MENERLLMKRKDIDRVNEDFSDFPLSSPARKIRRLDIDLPSIIEDEEEEEVLDMAMHEACEEDKSIEDKAIVLFKPLHYHQPPSGQIFVDRDLIFSFKNRFLRGVSMDDNNHNKEQTSNQCQAVVCWNPSQSPYSQSARTFQQPRTLEIEELDETGEDAVMDEAAMEIEDDNRITGLSLPQRGHREEPTYDFGLHQWQQQQHCMIPQFPQVSTTPITLFR